MLELVVSAVLLAALLSMIAPVLKWIGQVESLNAQRQSASEHLSNVMEQVAALNPNQRTQAKLDELCKQGLDELSFPKPEASVAITEETEPAGQRIQLSLKWSAENGSQTSPVLLTAWFY